MGAKELFNLVEQRKAEVEAVFRSVRGLVSYTLVRSAEGGMAVTVCEAGERGSSASGVSRLLTQERSRRLFIELKPGHFTADKISVDAVTSHQSAG